MIGRTDRRGPTYHRGGVRAAGRLVGLLALAAWAACSAPAPQPIPSDADPAFRVSEPSRLFFLNVRANSYYQERPKGTELDLYRSRRFSQTAQRPVLVPVIVHAWLKGEAYLFVRPNAFPELAPGPVVRWRAGDTLGGRHVLRIPTRPAQFAFANDLYASMLAGHELAVQLRDSTFAPVFETRAERAAYLAVMRDYYRLTDRM